MPNTLQEFLASAARKAAVDLETALLRLPEDKRNWSPSETARPALDLVAECAILNGNTADILQAHAFPADFDLAAYEQAKKDIAGDWPALRALLVENTARAAEAISALPDADLAIEVEMPWGILPLSQIVTYPYWNMSYHEGQINYIASILGCLK